MLCELLYSKVIQLYIYIYIYIYIHTHIMEKNMKIFFSIMVYYRILSVVPSAVQ